MLESSILPALESLVDTGRVGFTSIDGHTLACCLFLSEGRQTTLKIEMPKPLALAT